MRRSLLLMAVLFACARALGAEPSATEAELEKELERELAHETHLPPPTLEVRFDGVETPRYELLEAHFALDGKPLSFDFKPGPQPRKSTILFFGIVSPGSHVVTAELVFRVGHGSAIFTYVDASKFKVPGRVVLNAQRGLVLALHTQVEVNDGASEPSKRLAFVAGVDAHMVAKDASLPEQEPVPVASAKPPVVPAPAVAPPPLPAPVPPPAAAPTVGAHAPGKKLRPKRRRRVAPPTALAQKAPAGSEEPEVSSRALKALLHRSEEPQDVNVSSHALKALLRRAKKKAPAADE